MKRKRRRKPTSDGLRLTKVGVWFLIFLVVVVVAATNTGNNGLFLVLAVMGALLLVSEVAARRNVRGLRLRLEAPEEIFANTLSRLSVEIENRSLWLPRWLLVVAIDPGDISPRLGRPRRRTTPLLASHLPRRGQTRGQLELLMPSRGRWRVRTAHVISLFPFGFFRKGMRYPVDRELLVYPEIFAPSQTRPAQTGRAGDVPIRRPGWGHELLGLRAFRHGDDPRGIHWKQTARTGKMVFKEREGEESRRLLIVFDNAVGALEDEATRKRFERLVSEAATAALDYLDSGFEVSLLSRDHHLPFAAGRRQRGLLLEALALLEARPVAAQPLLPRDLESPYLQLAMEPREGPADGGAKLPRQEVA